MWPDTPQERHRTAAAAFGDRVRGAVHWDAPTPVAEWRARDVVRHLLEWLPGLLEAGAGVRLSEVSLEDGDLADSWAVRTAEVQRLLDERGAEAFSHPRAGSMSLADAIDRFYVSDVVMHTWDLARATGQDDRLDPEFCEQAYAGMDPMADMLAASGQFGARVPVAPDADAQDQLIGLIGRDPAWRPPAAR